MKLIFVFLLALSASLMAESDRYYQLVQSIRCPQCDNQAITHSSAPASEAIRNFVLRSIERGDNDAKIIDALKQSYGDAISYQPPWQGWGLWVWLPPLVIAGLFIYQFMGRVKRR